MGSCSTTTQKEQETEESNMWSPGMNRSRHKVLSQLNAMRQEKDYHFNNFREFNQLYHKHKKILIPEDQSMLDA